MFASIQTSQETQELSRQALVLRVASMRPRLIRAQRVLSMPAPYPSNNVCPNNVKGGVWRSTDSGATWTQMKNALNATLNTDRASFAVTPIAGGLTRMYVGVRKFQPGRGESGATVSARTMQ